MAAGTYNEAITLVEGISLYGGYNSSDWTDRRFDSAARSNATYRTVINNAAGNGITANDPAIDSFTVVEGFVIQSANADGIQIDSASPAIRENSIYAGTGANINGIEMNASAAVIANNSIYAEMGQPGDWNQPVELLRRHMVKRYHPDKHGKQFLGHHERQFEQHRVMEHDLCWNRQP